VATKAKPKLVEPSSEELYLLMPQVFLKAVQTAIMCHGGGFGDDREAYARLFDQLTTLCAQWHENFGQAWSLLTGDE